MQFDSIDFLLFLVVLLTVFSQIKGRARIFLLLLASYFFYMYWNVSYSLLLLASTLIDYYLGFRISKSSGPSKKIFLGLSLFSNLGLLAVFKYAGFISVVIGSSSNIFAGLLLPVGISFYTFQTMSYSIDIYRGDIKPEKDFFKFALYVSFFPQLVAGPIERAGHIIPQLSKGLGLKPENLSLGFRYILWGLFQKMVLADQLGQSSDLVFENIQMLSGILIWAGLLAFSFQIYFDFSAYSNIAIGCGRLFGIEIMQNFNRPYMAKTVADFWRRWHISLSTWFRDYLYIPLGGNQKGFFCQVLILLVVFGLSGLWHGANYNFVLWGLAHAAGLIAFLIYRRLKPREFHLPAPLSWLITILFVTLTWLLFRAGNANEIQHAFKHLLVFNANEIPALLNLGVIPYLVGAIIVAVLETRDWFNVFPERLGSWSPVQRWSTYYLILILIGCFGAFKSQAFIYFQF